MSPTNTQEYPFCSKCVIVFSGRHSKYVYCPHCGTPLTTVTYTMPERYYYSSKIKNQDQD